MKPYPMKFETYSLSEMMKPHLLRMVFIGLILFFINKTFAQSHDRVSDKGLKAQAVQWMAAQKPLGFQENKGQMADENGKLVPNVLFKMEVPNLNIWLTTSGLTYQFWKREESKEAEERRSGIGEMKKMEEMEKEMQQGSRYEWVRVDMVLKDASIKKSNILTEREITIGRHDYYLGHCPDGVIDVKTYGRLAIKEIYPGIDWILYVSATEGLKYDFIVHPGADPHQIKLIYEGTGKLRIKNNQVHFENKFGKITEGALLCYQNDESNIVPSFYTLKETGNKIKNGFSFEVGIESPDYDRNESLVIDPQLVWATYYGGEGGEKALDIATDGNNNIFVGGYTSSLAFPTQSFGAAYYQGTNNGGGADLFILKFNSSGILLWAIYYGGSNMEFWNNDITTDATGSLFFVGSTGSVDLPTMAMTGAYNDPTANGGGWDGFILKFNSSGVRQWATYLGGNSWDMITSVKEYQGNLFVSGVSSSPNFPTFNPGAPAYYDGSWAGPAGDMDIVILKFNNLGALTWSTFYGNAGLEDWNSINIDGLGNIYVVGEMEVSSFPVFNKPGAYNQNVTSTASEGYIIEFASNLSLQWATCLGGSGGDFPCFWNGVSFDSSNNLYVAGYTTGNFPIVNLPGAYNQAAVNDGFITKFNAAGAMVWSTYIGGTGLDRVYSSVIDACDNLYVCGIATPNFPTINLLCNSYFDNSLSGSSDGFITQFNSLGAMVWSTYYGGSGGEDFQDICIDKNYNLLVAGNTTSADFPTQSWGSAFVDNSNGGGGDAAVLKFVPPPPFTTAQSQVNPSGCSACNGTAAITITSACGVPPYSYLWNTGATTSNIAGLCAGGYSVVVSDGNCQKQRDTLYYTLTGGSGGITAGVTGTNANCNSNGSATVTAGGGISPYTYLWSNGTTSIAATGLGAGIYTVTVTDNSGCLKTQTVSITIGGGLSATTSFQAVKCYANSDGTATVTIAGGTIPYTYLWNNGQGAQTATGLSAGTYLLTITDIAGCKITKSISVTEPPPVLYVATNKQSTCGLSNGSATVTASNGTPSYTYNWSTGSAAQTISGLSAGVYTVTITDANGCKAIPQIKITAIPLASISLTTTNGTCGNGGSANANVTGGTMPYTYAWSASGGQTSSSATALSAGNYTVSVTDANGCTSTKTFTITDTPSLATATFTQSPAGTVCVGATINFTNTGTIGTYNWVISIITPVNVSGQTADFSYVFLTAGTYTVSHTVTTSGCSKTVTSTVNVINCTAGPTVTATGTSVCPGTCATVTSSGTGGTAPYTFTWSNGSTSQNINPCPASTTTYTVTIKDAGGNTSASTAVVTVNPAVTAATTVTNINCNGGTGSVAAVGGGGTSPYIYNWNIGQTTSTVTGLIAGNYVVTITDSKGCTSISTATITTPPPLIGQFSKGTSTCGGCGCKEWIMVNAVGGTGPYNFTWPDGYISRYKNHLCPGVYTVNIADKNGCNVNVSLTAP